MASIHREVVIERAPEQVWDALRDVGALHRRLCPGFVTDVVLEPGARVVTFGNGLVAREVIVDLDETARRLAWSASGGRLTHHNASAQVFAEGERRTRFVWIADLLPNEMAPAITAMIEQGIETIRKTLEQPPSARRRRGRRRCAAEPGQRDAGVAQPAERGEAGGVGGAEVLEPELRVAQVVAERALELRDLRGREAAFDANDTPAVRLVDGDSDGHVRYHSNFDADASPQREGRARVAPVAALTKCRESSPPLVRPRPRYLPSVARAVLALLLHLLEDLLEVVAGRLLQRREAL